MAQDEGQNHFSRANYSWHNAIFFDSPCLTLVHILHFPTLLPLILGKIAGVSRMQVQIQYQGTESSPWMDQLIMKKISKLDRYLRSSASIDVILKTEGKCFKSTLFIRDRRQDFTFSAIGYNLYESFSLTLDMALKTLSEHQRKLKEKVHRKFAA